MKNRRNIVFFDFPKIRYSNAIWIQDGLISLFLFFIIYFRLHPALLYEFQRPVFSANWSFLKEHLLFPGGLVDYFSALFSQAFDHPFLGAFLLAIIIGLISLFTRKIIHVLWKVKIHTLHWIPGLFLLFMYANYETPVSLVIGSAIILVCIWMFFRWSPKSTGLRIGLYTLYAGLLYWFCGGPFLLFTIYCSIWEWIISKSVIKVAIYLLISLGWCVVGPTFFFLIFFGQAIINNLPIEENYPPAFARWGLLLFFPLIGFLTFLIPAFSKFLEIKFRKMRVQPWIVGTILLLSVFSFVGWIMCDSFLVKQLMFFRASRKNNWEAILRLGKDPSYLTSHNCVQINRALWHTDRLLDSAFSYPQWKGIIGLIPDRDLCFKFPETATIIFFELGLSSESLHWNHELMEVAGETPETLERMGTIYFLKGEKKAAKMFWEKLKYTLQGRKRSEYLLELAESKDLLEKDKTMQKLSSLIPKFDFISIGHTSDRDLLFLLKQNPGNRMAFEYWVTYQLLEGDLTSVWNNIDKFRALGYNRIPRHVQEMLLLYAYLAKWDQPDALEYYVDNSIMQRFSEFKKIIIEHRKNKPFAQQLLKTEFRDTYWYYWMFVRSK
jgi:hypothetical protein